MILPGRFTHAILMPNNVNTLATPPVHRPQLVSWCLYLDHWLNVLESHLRWHLVSSLVIFHFHFLYYLFSSSLPESLFQTCSTMKIGLNTITLASTWLYNMAKRAALLNTSHCYCCPSPKCYSNAHPSTPCPPPTNQHILLHSPDQVLPVGYRDCCPVVDTSS